MASGVSGTRRTPVQEIMAEQGGNGILSAAKVTDLENSHQKLLNNLKKNKANIDEWDSGYESGSREILSELAGKDYSVSEYNLKPTGEYKQMTVSEIESTLNNQIQKYENKTHSNWNDGYFAGAVNMLEEATGYKYSVSGYKLKRVNK